MNFQPWKEAASLILVSRSSLVGQLGQNLARQFVASTQIADAQSRDHDQQQLLSTLGAESAQQEQRRRRLLAQMNATDYRIMMVKRSSLSSFMASAYVFPGGKVEPADFSPKWFELFDRMRIPRDALAKLCARAGQAPRPPMLTSQSVTLNNARLELGELAFLPPDVAMRIAAIRETFEETGVLLLTNTPDGDATPLEHSPAGLDLPGWREKVRSDADCFFELCNELHLCPHVWSLYEWWDWLTPISVGHKRFDTIFYVCCVQQAPTVVLDNREVTTLKWVSPLEMLEEHTQERVFLAPPQVYELSRLFHQRTFDQLRAYLPERERQGCERWLPVIGTYEDGAISLLPGDELYPAEPDYIGKKPVPDFARSLREMRAAGSRLNRIELTGPTCVAVCNQPLTRGHRSPIAYVRGCEEFNIDSKL